MKLKLEKKEDLGTHNGMKSVVHELLSEEFSRIRVGIGIPENKEAMIDYVIGELTQEQYEILEKAIEKASQAVTEILKNGIDRAMNAYNTSQT